VVLAAGKGKRMRSRLPKVLHPIAGRPMVVWAIEAARAAGCSRIVVVVGHDADLLRSALAGFDLVFVEQAQQLGTGHAVLQAAAALGEVPADLLVLSGDAPLVRSETLARLFAAADGAWGAMGVATVTEPGSLGRVYRDARGDLSRIVETADANAEDLAITTVNSGHYVLPAPSIFARLERVENTNAQGEIYLTDALIEAAARGDRVRCVELSEECEAWGVNDRRDLARVHRALVRRLVDGHLERGVTFLDPDSVELEAGVEVGPDCMVHADVSLLGSTSLGEGCTVHRGAWLRDTNVAPGVEIHPYSVLEGAGIGVGCSIGPFARLRPGTRLAERVRIGNFVEVKASDLGAGVRANHLAYLGDATVGARANIGAGTVTCNYDGSAKHRTTIGEDTFIGSDTMLVAPVTVGDRATTGAGSVITEDVPDDSLALGRARQRNLLGWVKRREP
jgi:bifunctional UDP-N-acetylglucosamine pyrophosphorylase/glucosamine-1-phosphate N-acetyltransferase